MLAKFGNKILNFFLFTFYCLLLYCLLCIVFPCFTFAKRQLYCVNSMIFEKLSTFCIISCVSLRTGLLKLKTLQPGCRSARCIRRTGAARPPAALIMQPAQQFAVTSATAAASAAFSVPGGRNARPTAPIHRSCHSSNSGSRSTPPPSPQGWPGCLQAGRYYLLMSLQLRSMARLRRRLQIRLQPPLQLQLQMRLEQKLG